MRLFLSGALLLVTAAVAAAAEAGPTLLEAREGHRTRLVRQARDSEGLEDPPPALFSKLSYPTKLGPMSAYLSKPQGPGRKPAIIWITGGFPAGGIGEGAWEARPASNDQSAKAYRQAGLVMMYPTLRGSAGNPGSQESFYGEVDDVLAAARFLAKQPFVDPDAIVLGGHSTGGTLALLAAATGYAFRAVIAFGPVDDPASYGAEALTYDPEDEKEARLRAPIAYLDAVACPTWVIEGEGGNIASLRALQKKSRNAKLSFFAIKGAGHFDVLAPINDYLASRLATHKGEGVPKIEAAELQGAFLSAKAAAREAADLRTLADLRAGGDDLRGPRTMKHYLLARERAPLEAAARSASSSGLKSEAVEERKDRGGRAYYLLILSKRLDFLDLKAVFACSKAAAALAEEVEAQYEGWTAEP